jgi:hypothetical protein
MSKTGPKSAAEVSVVKVEFTQKTDPPPELTKSQAKIWRGIVASEPADYFCTDALRAILLDYCQHRDSAADVSEIISTFKPEWMKSDEGARRYHTLLRMRDLETRAALSCATKLRLTNQSRYTPQAASTASRNRKITKKPWEV